jgi:phosphatidylserine decarboxylase
MCGVSDLPGLFLPETEKGGEEGCPGEGEVALPADGRHLGFQEIGREEGIYVKGQSWDLAALLGSREEAARMEGGTLVLSRLCPVDYHHFHFCLDGVPKAAQRFPGRLFSVSPIALRRSMNYFLRNERQITQVEHPVIGTYYQIEIGATNVGTIRQVYRPGVHVKKGDWKGGFKFGGSATVSLFPPGKVRLADDLVRNTTDGLETYAHFGDILGSIR